MENVEKATPETVRGRALKKIADLCASYGQGIKAQLPALGGLLDGEGDEQNVYQHISATCKILFRGIERLERIAYTDKDEVDA